MKINWRPLKLNVLPKIHAETKKLLDTFLATGNDIQEGDILALDNLKSMRSEVQSRISQIDLFYHQHCLDPRTKYLFSIRTILAQISEGSLSLINTYEQYMDTPQRQSKPQLPQISKVQERRPSPGKTEFPIVTPKTHEGQDCRSPSPFQSDPKHFVEASMSSRPKNSMKAGEEKRQAQGKPQQQSEPMRLSDLKQEKSKCKLAQRSEGVVGREEPRKGTGRKVEQRGGKEGGREEWLREEKERGALMGLSQGSQVKKSFRDLSELVFTIKMTKQEYNQFMRLKRKNNHA